MALRLTIEQEGHIHEIRVEDHLEKSGILKLSLKNDIQNEVREIRLMAHSGNRIVLSVDNRIFDLVVDQFQSSVSINWKNRTGLLQIFEGLAVSNPNRYAGSSGSGNNKAQMPGKVVSVLKKVGDIVSQGEGVLVIEAMKMQNEIKADRDGRLASCRVNPGDNVNTGDTLFKVEASC